MLRFNLAWLTFALLCMSTSAATARVCIRDLAGQIVCGEPIETRDEPSEPADPRQDDGRDPTHDRHLPQPRAIDPEPPCEPGKVRVIIRGNSQCHYPGEMRGARGYRDYDRAYGRGRVLGEGPSVGCPPGRVRVWDGSNGQCR